MIVLGKIILTIAVTIILGFLATFLFESTKDRIKNINRIRCILAGLLIICVIIAYALETGFKSNPVNVGMEVHNKLQNEIKDTKDLIKVLSTQKPSDAVREQLNKANQKLADLEKQEREFIETVNRLHEFFSKINIDTDRLKKAKYFFEQGRFFEADAVLKEEDLVNEQKKFLRLKKQREEELNEINKKLENNSTEFLIKAQLTALRYDLPDWFDKTIEYYERALKADRTPENLSEYAYFLNNHNKFDEAQLLYEETLEIYEGLAEINPPRYESDVAITLNNLGTLYYNNNNSPAALDAFNRVLEICERLAKTNPSAYESDVAMTFNNLGNVYSDNNNIRAARDAYNRALEIYERLAKNNPNVYESKLTILREALNTLSSDRKKYEIGL